MEHPAIPALSIAAVDGDHHTVHLLQLRKGKGNAIIGQGEIHPHQIPIGLGQVHVGYSILYGPTQQPSPGGNGADQPAPRLRPLQQRLQQGRNGGLALVGLAGQRRSGHFLHGLVRHEPQEPPRRRRFFLRAC